MLFAPLIIVDQASWHVRREARAGTAIWTEYTLDGARYTDLTVLVPERTLIPRDRIAHGVRASCRGLERDDVVDWLGRAGFQIATRP